MSTSQIVMPAGVYQPGTRNVGPQVIPQGVDRIRFSLDAAQLDNPAMIFEMALDLRWTNAAQEPWASDGGGGYDPFPYGYDGASPVIMRGGVFNPGTGLWEVGHPVSFKTGLPVAELFAEIRLPRPELPTRQLRARINITGIALPTTGTLTTFP